LTHYGIDVSSNNHNGDFDYVAAVEYLRNLGGGAQPFVFVKATESTTYTNPYFASDVKGFQDAGAKVGGYLFDHGDSDSVAELSHYKSIAGNLPFAWDIETPEGLDPQQYADHLQPGLKASPYSMVYLNQSEDSTMPGAPWGHPLWIAQWDGDNTASVSCWVHQYTDKGIVPGIGGGVDMNRWEASEEDFANFFGPSSAPTSISGEPSVLPTMAIGMTGNDVRELQNALHITADGIFGRETEAAVRAFQTSYFVDGIAGPLTLIALHL
jgi:lysozyme